MTFSARALLVIVIAVAAACSPVASSTPTPHATLKPSTARPATAAPRQTAAPVQTLVATAAANVSTDLEGEWFCYSYQAGVGTNAVNVSGIAGANSLLGSFRIENASRYAAFFGTDEGTYSLDSATSGISFDTGSMWGLAGTYGAGPTHDLIDLHGNGNGWDSPYAVSVICQHA